MSFKLPTDRPAIQLDFDPAVYHSPVKHKRGEPGFHMSKSELWRFRDCPHKWLFDQPKKVTAEMEWGSLVDCLLLTPDHFESQYAITPETYPDEKGTAKPWNWNANHCKNWRAANDACGIKSIKSADARDASIAVRSMKKDALITEFLESCNNQVAVSLDYHDDETGLVIPVRGLIDLVPKAGTKFENSLGDIKTTGDASHWKWGRTAYEQGYHYQAALYLDLFNAATGEQRNEFRHIVQESDYPFELARRLLPEEWIAVGRENYLSDLGLYAKCLRRDGFAGYEELDLMRGLPNRHNIDGWTVSEPEPWMIK